MNILSQIIKDKKNEVENDKKINKIENYIKNSKKKKNIFSKRLLEYSRLNKTAVIAEIKKASPSKGIIKKDFDHLRIAEQYINGGAACLSILTEKKYFLGNKKYVTEVKNKFNIPTLNKDFFVDPYQVYEANNNGADCILIIVNSTDKHLIKELSQVTKELEMDFLLEVHNEKEMEIALDIPGAILGINNRNLENFNVDINNTIRIYKNFKTALDKKILVSESGIFTKEDVDNIKSQTGINNFLIGESLIKSDTISDCLKKLIK